MRKFILIFLIWVIPTICYGATLNDFIFKKKLAFPTNTVTIAADVTHFPHVVEISSSSWTNAVDRANFFGSWNSGGKRVEFYDKDGNSLAYQVGYYSAGSQLAYYYVGGSTQVTYDSDDGTLNYIYLGFGNDPNRIDKNNPTGVWDSNFLCVLHLDENSTNPLDSTSNSNNGTRDGNTWVDGVVYKGQDFVPGSSQFITLPVNMTKRDTFTVSMWAKRDVTTDSYFFSTRDAAASLPEIRLYAASTSWLQFRAWDSADYQFVVQMNVFSDTTAYHHIACSMTDNEAKAYFDGSPGATDTSGAITSEADLDNAYLGRMTITYLDGKLDEFRYSSIVRGDDWQKLEYYSMYKTTWVGDGWYVWSTTEGGSSIPNKVIVH